MNNAIYLKIAGFYIKLQFCKTIPSLDFVKEKFKKNIITYYRGFISDDKPKEIDYLIKLIGARELPALKKNNHTFISLYEETGKNKIITYYQISQMQMCLVVRHVLGRLLLTKGFFLHASASNIEGKANIFLGKTGSGKSTVMTFLKERFPPLADDTIILKKESNEFYLYQTSFPEKNNCFLKNSNRYPIEGIFFLHKTNHFKKERIKDKDYILRRIISQFLAEKKCVNKQIPILMNFVSIMNNFYGLYFAKDKTHLIKSIIDKN